MVIREALGQGVLVGLTRADMKPTEVWADILVKVDQSPGELQAIVGARAALELGLLI